MPVTDALVRKLSNAQREHLLQHVDGPVPIIRRDARVDKSYLTGPALHQLGLVIGTPYRSMRPSHTILTESGRDAVAKILANYADALVTAGALDRENLRPLDLVALVKTGPKAAQVPDKLGESAENGSLSATK